MYGKLINGRLVPAPNPLHINRGLVYNPSSYLYEAVPPPLCMKAAL